MYIHEITDKLNELSQGFKISELQMYRKEHKNLNKLNSYNIFRNLPRSKYYHYAFHNGGSDEIQFNIGYEKDLKIFRYGLAFSLQNTRELPDISVLYPKIDKFNYYLLKHPAIFSKMFRWTYIDGKRSSPLEAVRPIEDDLKEEGTFIFIGNYFKKTFDELSNKDLINVLKTFDKLFYVYKYVENNQHTIPKMIIQKEMTQKAYDVAKKVFEEQLSSKEGKKYLVDKYRMNSSSATTYIYNFKCMIMGKVFTRTNNAYSVDYFLNNIFKDYGALALTRALISLKLHIDYYERHENVKLHSMREIYERYIMLTTIYTPDEQEQNEIVEENKKKTKFEMARELKQLESTDQKIITINHKSYKRDNRIIALIKSLRGLKCQICSKTIKKKDGNFYIEAAHITPKYQNGREASDNIILLCPNHHKEFDLGNTQIIKRDVQQIKILLNGHNHTISLRSN